MKRRKFMKGLAGLGCAAVGVKAVAEVKPQVTVGLSRVCGDRFRNAQRASNYALSKMVASTPVVTLPKYPKVGETVTITAGERPVIIRA